MEANPLYKRPWDIVARFSTFEEADKKRNQLKKEEDLQVKVKKQLTGYVVKARSTIIEEKKRTKSRRKDKNFYKQKVGSK